ncbi:MAG TPA: GNAT family N-acetyltransferase [Tepidisphaeraceae bacterium]|nr:GNAT family N-acetyltransferase [Tepidisphaeraceae bacterium]
MNGVGDTSPRWIIRSFKPEDLPGCRTLYREGLIGGKIAENDTGLDIDDIESAYMRTRGNHFWVAELIEPAPAPLVGMIGVQHFDGTAQIRRLRVTPSYRRRGIGTALVETALQFCRDQEYLKVTLDTFMEREPAIKMFEKFRFHLDRARQVMGKEMFYFYLDLYSGMPRPHKGDAGQWSVGASST